MAPPLAHTEPAPAGGGPDPAAVRRHFPFLTGELGERFARHATRRVLPRGAVVYEQGFPCELVPFIVAGVVRVFKLGENGREVTLFRVYPGQTCILSTSCGVSGASYPAIAEAEADVEMWTVPVRLFRQWMQAYPALQAFVSGMLSDRLADMMLVVEEVAFRRVDLRLAEWLLRASEPPASPVLEATHAHIAVELGSAREVISRILKDFERHGYVRLGRGRVEVADREALAAFRDGLQGRRPQPA